MLSRTGLLLSYPTCSALSSCPLAAVIHVSPNSPNTLEGSWREWLVLSQHPKIQTENMCAEMHALLAPSFQSSSSLQPTNCQGMKITQSTPLLACLPWISFAYQSIYCRNESLFAIKNFLEESCCKCQTAAPLESNDLSFQNHLIWSLRRTGEFWYGHGNFRYLFSIMWP